MQTLLPIYHYLFFFWGRGRGGFKAIVYTGLITCMLDVNNSFSLFVKDLASSNNSLYR